MELVGEYRIAANRQAVWDALNDTEILKQCIPGCDELTRESDTEMSAKVTAKVGPVKAKFAGNVTLSDIDAPNGYTISGEGKGGAAGFAKGGAKVTLEADGDGTLLTYEVNASVGGKLAQLGGRLIDSTAKKLSGEFFDKFSQLVEQQTKIDAPQESPADENPIDEAPENEAERQRDEEAYQAIYGRTRWKGFSPMTWISGAVFFILLIVYVIQILMSKQ